MGIYNTFEYGDGTLYGQSSKIEFSAEPFNVVAVSNEKISGKVFPKVVLEWTNPAGAVAGVRIVRNQTHYAETEEDGVIVFESVGLPNVYTAEDYLNAINLKTGKYAYYTVWVLKSDFSWVMAANNYVLIPEEHGVYTPEGEILRTSHDKFLDLIPRMYVSRGQSAIDVPDKTSDLSLFLEGFSYTLDELLSYADLLMPDASAANLSPSMMYPMAIQLGIKNRPWFSQHIQQKLIREAIYLYSNKGTLNGVGTAIEGVTGFAPEINVSPNVLLSAQDSSFYKGVGNWVAGTGAVLTVDDTEGVSIYDPWASDVTHCGKVVTSDVNKVIRNGFVEPRLNAAPITAGKTYSARMNVKTSSGTATVTCSIHWFDSKGNDIATDNHDISATTTWDFDTWDVVAPGGDVIVNETLVVSGVATLYLDPASPIGFDIGEVVTVRNLGYPFNGSHTITDAGAGYISFATTAEDTDATLVDGIVSGTKAYYAGIEVKFAAAGTYFVDRFQLADSTDDRSTEYYEGRGVEIYLRPSKTNRVTNPSFVDWDADGGTVSLGDGNDGWAVTNCTLTGTDLTTEGFGISNIYGTNDSSIGAVVAVDPEADVEVSYQTSTDITIFEEASYYTFSAYVNTSKLTGGVDVAIFLKFAQMLDGEEVLSVDNFASAQPHFITRVEPGNSKWTRISEKIYLPVNFDPVTTVFTASIACLYIADSDNNLGTETLYIDGAQLEQGYKSSDYMDGSFDTRGAQWAGAANNSISYQYINRGRKVAALTADLPSILPLNTAYLITTGSTIDKRLDYFGFSS